MAATFPGGVKVFTTKQAGDQIASAHINDLQDEVVAVETELRKTTGSVVSHGSLAGLSNNDHPQYLLTTGKAADSDKLGGILASGYAVAQKSSSLALSTNVSISNAAWTVLDWDTERWDDDNMHDNATNPSRITIKSEGRYQLEVVVHFDANSDGTRCVRISKNGTTADVGRTNLAPIASPFKSMILTTAFEACSVGDYFIVQVYQNSGVSLDVLSLVTKFSCTRVN